MNFKQVKLLFKKDVKKIKSNVNNEIIQQIKEYTEEKQTNKSFPAETMSIYLRKPPKN